MSKAQQLIATLASEGQLKSEGRFTLDREKAREKLQRFQLAEPERYVVLMVEAALLMGAQRVEIRIDGDDVRVEHDGLPLSHDELETLWDSILDEGRGRPGLRQLALSINAAMGLSPKLIHVESGGGESRFELSMAADQSMRVRAGGSAKALNYIHVRERLQLATIKDAWAARRGLRREQVLLREHCAYVQTPILLDGELISRGFPDDLGPGALCFHGEAYRAVVALAPLPTNPSSVVFCCQGVRIVEHRLEGYPAGLTALVDSTKLRRDVSQAEVRRDEHFNEVMNAVHEQLWRCIAELGPRLTQAPSEDASEGVDRPVAWTPDDQHALLLGALERCGAETFAPTHPLHSLLDLPIWRTVSDQTRSTKQLIDQVARDKTLPTIAEAFDGFVPEGEQDVLLTVLGHERRAIKALFEGKVKNRHRQFERALKRRRNEARWRSARAEPVLPSGAWTRRRAFEDGSIRGEVGLSERPGRMDILVDGGHLCSFVHELALDGIHIVIEGPFRPRKNFDGVHRDDQLIRALVLATRALWDLLGSFEGVLGEAPEQRSRWVNEMLPFLMEAPFGSSLLHAAGFRPEIARRHLTRVASAKRRPSLNPKHPRAHALTRVPLVAATHRSGRLTLAEIQDLLDAGNDLIFFKAGRRAEHDDDIAPPALLLDKKQREFIGQVWKKRQLDDAARVRQAWQAKRDFLARPTLRAIEDELDSLSGQILVASRFEGGRRIWLLMDKYRLAPYWGAPDKLASVDVRVSKRQLVNMSLTARLPGLRILVELPEAHCKGNFHELPEADRDAVDNTLRTFETTLAFEDTTTWPLDDEQRAGLYRALIEARSQGDDFSQELRTTLLPFTSRILLKTLRGGSIPLSEVVEAARKSGGVEYSERVDLAAFAPPHLIGGAPMQLRFVADSLPWPVSDVSDRLIAQRRAAQLRDRPQVDALVLARPTLVELPMPFGAKLPQARGRVGLACVDPWQEDGELHCYLEMREVETMATPIELPLDASVNAAWRLSSTTTIERGLVYEQVRDALRSCRTPLLAELLKDWRPKHGSVRALRARWALALATSLGPEALDEEVREKLYARRFIGRHQASPLSLRELVAEAERRRENRRGRPTLTWIDEGRASLLDPPPGVLLLDDDVAGALGRLLNIEFVDIAVTIAKRRQARTGRPDLHARVDPSWAKHFAFVSAQLKGVAGTPDSAWSAHLWIDAFGRELQLGAAGKFVNERALWGGLSISGVVEVPPSWVEDDWCAMRLSPIEQELRARGYDLVRDLIARVHEDPLLEETARHRLARMHRQLEQDPSTLPQEPAWLRSSLASAPILVNEHDEGPAWISPSEQIRREALAQERARQHAELMQAAAQQKLAQLSDLRGRLLRRSAADRLASSPRETTSEDEGQAAHRPFVDPRGQLLESVVAELRLAASATRTPLNEAQIDQLDFAKLEPSVPFDVANGPQLNPAHPLVRHAIAKGADDRGAQLFCAALGLGALNLWLEEVQDSHEVSLILALLRRLSETSPASSNA